MITIFLTLLIKFDKWIIKVLFIQKIKLILVSIINGQIITLFFPNYFKYSEKLRLAILINKKKR